MQQAQSVAAGIFVVVLMFSVGLDLELSALVHSVRRPAGILAGLVAGYVLAPAVALGLATLLHLGPGARAGLLLCSVAPGGPMGAYLALGARGRVALAAALVLLFNVLNTVLIPVGLDLLGVPVDASGDGAIWAMAQTILMFQIAPLTVGLVLRRLDPGRAAGLKRLSSRVANGLLAVFGAAVVLLQGHRFVEAGLPTLLAVEGTVLAGLVGGWIISPRDRPSRAALACVGVIHSSSACILLASRWFQDPATMLTVLTWSGCMFLTGVVAARLMARSAPRPAAT